MSPALPGASRWTRTRSSAALVRRSRNTQIRRLRELDEEGQRIAEVLFKSLTERSPDHPDARRPTTVEAVSTIAGVPWPDTVRVADAFRRSDRSFLTPSGSQALKSSDTLDISHESLIRQWLKLSEWVETEADPPGDSGD